MIKQGFATKSEQPAQNDRQPIDRDLGIMLRYNYLRDLREGRKPNLYGPGIDFYEEERIRIEQLLDW